MNLFQLRKPPLWSLLIAGLIFAALCTYAVMTNTFVIPPSHTQPGKVILKSKDPKEFSFWLRFSGLFSFVTCAIALIKCVPLEGRFAAWKTKIKIKAEKSGASTKPIPAIWSYSILGIFLIFVLYLGYLLMYKE